MHEGGSEGEKCYKTEDKREAHIKKPSKLKGQRHEMLYRATKIEGRIRDPWLLYVKSGRATYGKNCYKRIRSVFGAGNWRVRSAKSCKYQHKNGSTNQF